MHRALTLYTYLTILQFVAIGLNDQGCVVSQGQREQRSGFGFQGKCK
jgi:hypothetical protein